MADITLALSLMLIFAVLAACFLFVFAVIVFCEQVGRQLIEAVARKCGKGPS